MYTIHDISSNLPRHGTLRYSRRNPAGVVCVMPHHYGGWGGTPEKAARAHILPDASRGKSAWPGIAYDYFIPEENDFNIYQCHALDEKGYHCGGGGMNTKALSICVAGNFDERPPEPWQIDKLVWLIVHTNEQAGTERLIVWHNDYVATACPGRFFPKAEVISRVAAHYDPEPEPSPTPEPSPEPEPEKPDEEKNEEPTDAPKEPQDPEKPKGGNENPGCLGFLLPILP